VGVAAHHTRPARSLSTAGGAVAACRRHGSCRV